MNAPLRDGIDLRLGDWRTALAGVEQVDCLISDPPFSRRVHEGQRTGTFTRRSTIEYEYVTPDWCDDFVGSWAPRVRHWALVFSDHTASHWWEAAFERSGWYVFAPVLWIRTNPTPRIAGDGPTSACDYITVSRPRKRLETGRTGSRPGYYLTQNDPGSVIVPGGKQLLPMRAIVRDYSRPGDLIVDPCAGGATTLIAAVMEGRRAVGSELDPDTYAKARARCAEYPVDLTGTQGALFGGERGA